mgnify:CR=1 FL=1|jgi:acid stress-induced BolA-like protein IbaG/YrbA
MPKTLEKLIDKALKTGKANIRGKGKEKHVKIVETTFTMKT